MLRIATLFLVLLAVPATRGEGIPLQGAAGKVIAFDGVKEANPTGLVVRVRPDEAPVTVPWDKFDLEAIEAARPEIAEARRKIAGGAPRVELLLGSFKPVPVDLAIAKRIDEVSVHEEADPLPAWLAGRPLEPFLFDNDKGHAMRFRFFAPRKQIMSNEKFPLVVTLHGNSAGGDDNARHLSLIAEAATSARVQAEHPCFVLSPQFGPVNDNWFSHTKSRGTAGLQTLDLIDALCAAIPAIDGRRVYVMGMSQGAFAIPYMLVSYPGRFAAAVPFAGGSPIDFNPRNVVPAWIFYSTDDEVAMQLDGTTPKLVESMKRVAPKRIRTTVYADAGHGGTLRHGIREEGLFQWLFAQKQTRPPSRDPDLIHRYYRDYALD